MDRVPALCDFIEASYAQRGTTPRVANPRTKRSIRVAGPTFRQMMMGCSGCGPGRTQCAALRSSPNINPFTKRKLGAKSAVRANMLRGCTSCGTRLARGRLVGAINAKISEQQQQQQASNLRSRIIGGINAAIARKRQEDERERLLLEEQQRDERERLQREQQRQQQLLDEQQREEQRQRRLREEEERARETRAIGVVKSAMRRRALHLMIIARQKRVAAQRAEEQSRIQEERRRLEEEQQRERERLQEEQQREIQRMREAQERQEREKNEQRLERVRQIRAQRARVLMEKENPYLFDDEVLAFTFDALHANDYVAPFVFPVRRESEDMVREVVNHIKQFADDGGVAIIGSGGHFAAIRIAKEPPLGPYHIDYYEPRSSTTFAEPLRHVLNALNTPFPVRRGEKKITLGVHALKWQHVGGPCGIYAAYAAKALSEGVRLADPATARGARPPDSAIREAYTWIAHNAPSDDVRIQ